MSTLKITQRKHFDGADVRATIAVLKDMLKKNRVFRPLTGSLGDRMRTKEIVCFNHRIIPETRILKKARVLILKLFKLTGAEYDIDGPVNLKKLFADALKAAKLLDETDRKAEHYRNAAKKEQAHTFPFVPKNKLKRKDKPKGLNGFNSHQKHFLHRKIGLH